MGIYIPNMEKPKSCKECESFYIEFYMGENKMGSACTLNDDDGSTIEADYNSCPLIDIDLERGIPTIWYNRQTGQYEPKDTKQEVYERLYKLKNGERRADD